MYPFSISGVEKTLCKPSVSFSLTFLLAQTRDGLSESTRNISEPL